MSDRKYVEELLAKYLSSDARSKDLWQQREDNPEKSSSVMNNSRFTEDTPSFTGSKQPDFKEQGDVATPDNNPSSILKKRLASGEITSKEYDKLQKKFDKEEKSQNKKMKEKSIKIESRVSNDFSKKKMSAKKKVGIGIGIFFVIIIIMIVGFFASYYVAPSSVLKANPDDITGVSQYFVLKDGSLYKVRFSLDNKNNAFVTSAAKINFIVKTQDGRTLFSDTFNIKSEDFQTYSLVLTGAPVVAYSWQIDGSKLQHSDTDFPKAYLTVTLPNGKSFNADAPVF